MTSVTRTWIMTASAIALGAVISAPVAFAIPAFAREYNVACSTCHTAVPYLNSTGRHFKEAGYRMPDEDGEIDPDSEPMTKIGKWLSLESAFPISARVVGRPYDNKQGSDSKLDVIHEVELLMAGSYGRAGSFFVEAEGEDETDFQTEISGQLGWHPSRAAIIQGGYGSLFHSDPYNSLKDGGHRLTVAHKLALSAGSSSRSRIRKSAQNLNFYGRHNKLFYLAGYSAGNGNPEGKDPKDFVARLAYDFAPNLMVGAIYMDGQRSSLGLDLQRVGVDFNLDFGDLHVVGLYLAGEEDPYATAAATENNDSGYVESFYTYKKDSRPFFVPLVRYGFSELNDGRDQLSAVTAQLAFYFVENARVGVEYYSELDNAPGKPKLDRFTVFADIAF